jgi:hypothetical protein
MPKCEKCGKDIPNAERREFSVLHISGVYCDICYNLLNGLNWVMGASLYGCVWHSLSLQEKSNFIHHYQAKQKKELDDA